MVALLQAESVSFQYPQEERRVGEISIQVDAGQALHLSGNSGCGKSTLARCLTGLIPHLYHGQLSGEVYLGGSRTDETPLWQLTEKSGLVFQNPAAQMLAPTVAEEIIFGLENLGLSVQEIDQRVESVLEDFCLSEMRLRSPQTLSGGEQQKLALAAMVARQPPLLVLDEPLSMLDTTSAFDFVVRLNRQLEAGRGLVICEHRQEYLQRISGLSTVYLDRPGMANAVQMPESPGLVRHDLILEAKSLCVTRGGREILRDLSFSLPGGQVAALVGPNGAGKTTLLRTLAGLQAHIGELSVTSDDKEYKPALGLVFQNPDLQLFNPTVRQEILFRIAEPDMHWYRWLIAALDLSRYEETPPLLLSEGEKRRLALAMLLMHRPRHGLLLDEPALGQDMAHKSLLISLLRAVAETGQIVIYATHDIELAAQADRLILLGEEGIVTNGQPGQVLHDEAAWQRLGLRIPDWVNH